MTPGIHFLTLLYLRANVENDAAVDWEKRVENCEQQDSVGFIRLLVFSLGGRVVPRIRRPLGRRISDRPVMTPVPIVPGPFGRPSVVAAVAVVFRHLQFLEPEIRENLQDNVSSNCK